MAASRDCSRREWNINGNNGEDSATWQEKWWYFDKPYYSQKLITLDARQKWLRQERERASLSHAATDADAAADDDDDGNRRKTLMVMTVKQIREETWRRPFSNPWHSSLFSRSAAPAPTHSPSLHIFSAYTQRKLIALFPGTRAQGAISYRIRRRRLDIYSPLSRARAINNQQSAALGSLSCERAIRN